jgi:hypothetical protein
MAFLGASNSVVDVCPKLRVRVLLVPPIPPLSGNKLASVALVDSVSPYLSNVDVLLLKRKELREYILVSLVSTPRLFHSLICILHIYLFLVCLSLVGNSPSCTSSESTLCQALKLKKTKNWNNTYSPSSRPLDPFRGH